LDDTKWLRPDTHFSTRSAQSWLTFDGFRYETQPAIADLMHRAPSQAAGRDI
jgi:hypothetical protein